jgi:hypothetical protein
VNHNASQPNPWRNGRTQKYFTLLRIFKSFISTTTSSQLPFLSNIFFFLVAGRHLLFLLHIVLFAGELPTVLTFISLAEFPLIKMSSFNQSTGQFANHYNQQFHTYSQQPQQVPQASYVHQALQIQQFQQLQQFQQAQQFQQLQQLQHAQQVLQPARAQVGVALPQMQGRAPPTNDPAKLMLGHIHGLTINFLDQNPKFFTFLLQKHEKRLAAYVYAEYNIILPARQNLQHPPPPQSVADFDLPIGGTQNNVSSSTNLPKLAEQQQKPESSENSPDSHYAISQPSVGSNGDSPGSKSSKSDTWPTEEDKRVPYPAPQHYRDQEVGLPRGDRRRWTFEEQDMAIEHMLRLDKDTSCPRTEVRWEYISNHLIEHGINRTPTAVKNMWNRIGRARSGLDERKNKSAPLATSMQGKKARLENEAKKGRKRKASTEPAESVQKKTRRVSQGSKVVSDTYAGQPSAQGQANFDASFDDPQYWDSLGAQFSDQEDSDLVNEASQLSNTSQTQPQMQGDHAALPPTSTSQVQAVQPSSVQDDPTFPQFIQADEVSSANQVRPHTPENNAALPPTVTSQPSEVQPSNVTNDSQIQSQNSGTASASATIASAAEPALPTLPSDAFDQLDFTGTFADIFGPDGEPWSDEAFAQLMMAEVSEESEKNEFELQAQGGGGGYVPAW